MNDEHNHLDSQPKKKARLRFSDSTVKSPNQQSIEDIQKAVAADRAVWSPQTDEEKIILIHNQLGHIY